MNRTFTSTRPIYKQVEEYIKRDISEGVLARGSKMPVYRLLAANLGISPSAVQHAYDELVTAAIFTVTNGEYIVTADSNSETVIEVTDPAIESLTAEYCKQMIGYGVPRKTIIDIVCAELVKYNKPSSGTEDGQ